MHAAVRLLMSALLCAALASVMPPPAAAQAPAAPQQAPAAAQPQPSALLNAQQLEQLVAPIALYPDTLLAQVLMASTYPLEVVFTDRWLTQNKNLKGDQLKTEVQKQGWDESVTSLVATPEVLSMMSSKLEWTQQLGDAVLAQQPDVMDAIQRLRAKAQDQKKLTTTKQQKVSVKKEQNKDVIVIEPTTPDTIYVPYYDPAVVYGAWPYPAYPPYYFPAPGYIAGGIIATGIAFGAGYALGRWTSGGNYWGGSVNWGGSNININRPIDINRTKINHFSHKPEHRHGVKYRNDNVQKQFGGGRTASTSDRQMDFRGRDGQQVLRPDGDRPGGGARPDAGRPGGGAEPDAGRPGGGAKPMPDARAAAPSLMPDVPVAAPSLMPDARWRPQARRRTTGWWRQARGRTPRWPRRRRPGRGRDGAFSRYQQGRWRRARGCRPRPCQSRRRRRPWWRRSVRWRRRRRRRRWRSEFQRRWRRRGGGGGGGGRGGGGGGRRSDMTLKHDIALLGYLPNGLGYYRFSYVGSNRAYVGVMAQEVETVMPEAVMRDRDGSLRVLYEKLGVRFQTYEEWIAKGAQVPAAIRASH